MARLPVPTPAQARKIWESIANPSTRRVATRLRQAGLTVSHMRVARWRNRGWKQLTHENHVLEAARIALDDAVPLLTGDPNTTAKILIEQDFAERAKLEQLTDEELLSQTARDVAITAILVCRALRRQVNAVFPAKIGELATLMTALFTSLEAVDSGFKQAADMKSVGNARPKPQ